MLESEHSSIKQFWTPRINKAQNSSKAEKKKSSSTQLHQIELETDEVKPKSTMKIQIHHLRRNLKSIPQEISRNLEKSEEIVLSSRRF